MEDGGPDAPSNLFVASPDFHARYDAGTIDILDDYSWTPVGPHQDDIIRNWAGPRTLLVPEDPEKRLAPKFLQAHRESVRKRYVGR